MAPPNASAEVKIYTTGKQIDGIVTSLIASTDDNNNVVRTAVQKSLETIGCHHSQLVLSSVLHYLVTNPKCPLYQRITLMNGMSNVIKETLPDINLPLAVDIIKHITHELISSKEVKEKWQGAASAVLVRLGERYCADVMHELLDYFKPATVPHFYIVKTMADLATANVFDFVPFLKSISVNILPMMTMAKQDNMRWVFSYALCKFCEAIQEYIANIEKARDNTIKRSTFSEEIFSAYDILFSVWLSTKTPTLRIMIVEALGEMSQLVDKEKLIEQLPKLLQTIISLYNRHTDPYHITQGLSNILTACTSDDSTMLEPLLEKIFAILYTQVCHPIDYAKTYTVKNHNEILRCFSTLAKPHSERVLQMLLAKLDNSAEKHKLGSLLVLRHLVNADCNFSDKKQMVIVGLSPVLNDNSNKVKKALTQVIVAMAHHDYLKQEGGKQYIDFILLQCTRPSDAQERRPSDADHVSNDALKLICINALQLLLTLENMHSVLWPHMLEYLTLEPYVLAIEPLTKCLSQIAQIKRDSEAADFHFNFSDYPDIPKQHDLFTRLLVLLGCTERTDKSDHITYVLDLLSALSTHLHDNLPSLWDVELKAVSALYQEQASDEWRPRVWQERILKLFLDSLEEINSEEFTTLVGSALQRQFNLYKTHQQKGFVLMCMGVVTQKAKKTDFITSNITWLFTTTQHANSVQRDALALAMGYSAVSHLDDVIATLDAMLRAESKKAAGIFSFIKSDVDENTKASLILSYGYVTYNAHKTLIAARIDTQIIKPILKYLPSAKSTELRISMMRCIALIGEALHPSTLGMEFRLAARSELLKHIQLYLKAETATKITSELRKEALTAACALVNLLPVISGSELYDLVQCSLECTVPVNNGQDEKHAPKQADYESYLYKQQLLMGAYEAQQALLLDIFTADFSNTCLEIIFKHLFIWSSSPRGNERQTAMTLVLSLLQLYHQKIPEQAAGSFDILGSMLAKILPRCCDLNTSVCTLAIESVHCAMKILMKHKGVATDKLVDDVLAVQDLLSMRHEREKDVDTVSNAIIQCLKVHFPSEQMEMLVSGMIESLSDTQELSACCVGKVLQKLMVARAVNIHGEQLENILMALIEKVAQVTYLSTRDEALKTVAAITDHHMKQSIDLILTYPLPLPSYVESVWKSCIVECHDRRAIVTYMLDVLAKSLPYEEHPGFDKKVERVATFVPVAVTCAFLVILSEDTFRSAIAEMFPTLFAALIIRLASSVDVMPPKKMKVASTEDKSMPFTFTDKKGIVVVDREVKPHLYYSMLALKQLFQCIDEHGELTATLMNHNLFRDIARVDDWDEAAATLISALHQHAPQYISSMVSMINPHLSSVYEPQRIMAAAILARLVYVKCGGDSDLVDVVVNSLLSKLADPCLLVRVHCIKGLSNIAHTSVQQVEQYATTILSALMSGLEDSGDVNDVMSLACMSGLTDVLAQVQEPHVRAILINITLNIRLGFEKAQVSVRSTAFSLFGELSRFASGPSTAMYLEQIHSNIISFILHLNDPAMEVIKSCKKTLREVVPLLGADSMNSIIQQALSSDRPLHHVEFINSLSKAMIKDLPDKVELYIGGGIGFFKSQWPGIRTNAVIFVGCLVGNLPEGFNLSLSKEHICASLMSMSKDTHAEVKIHTAEALSKLYNY